MIFKLKEKREDAVAMMIAILTIIVVAGIMATMTIGAVSNAQQVRETRNHTYHTQAVESAVQNAIITANGSLGGCSNPEIKTNSNCIGYYTVKSPTVRWKKGKEGDINWQWRAEPITVNGEIHYDIFAIALGKAPNGDDISRALEVRLERVAVEDFTMDNRGNVNYIEDASRLFDMPLFGDSLVELQKGVTINSNTETGSAPAEVGTNGEVRYSVLSSVDDSEVFNVDTTVLANANVAGGAEDRCRVQENKGTGFGTPFLTRSEYMGQCLKHRLKNEKVQLHAAYNKVMESCLDKPNKGDWKASTAKKNAAGKAALTSGCYTSITVDADTEVYSNDTLKNPTPTDPAEIFITDGAGRYEQKAGKSIKPAGLAHQNNPSVFQLYSVGSAFSIINTVASNSIGNYDASFTGVAAGHNMTCSTTSFKTMNGIGNISRNANFTLNGSLVCNEIKMGSHFTVEYPAETLSDYGKDKDNFAIWEMGSYKNSTYDRVMNVS